MAGAERATALKWESEDKLAESALPPRGSHRLKSSSGVKHDSKSLYRLSHLTSPGYEISRDPHPLLYPERTRVFVTDQPSVSSYTQRLRTPEVELIASPDDHFSILCCYTPGVPPPGSQHSEDLTAQASSELRPPTPHPLWLWSRNRRPRKHRCLFSRLESGSLACSIVLPFQTYCGGGWPERSVNTTLKSFFIGADGVQTDSKELIHSLKSTLH